MLERFEAGVLLTKFALDPGDPPKHFIDLTKKVLVFDARDIQGAAGQAPLANPPFDPLVMPVHALPKKHELCHSVAAGGSRFFPSPFRLRLL